MHSRVRAAVVAFTVIILAGCSGGPPSSLNLGNGSLTPSLRLPSRAAAGVPANSYSADPWRGFSIVTNPNGVWSYLFTQTSTPGLLSSSENPCGAALGVTSTFPGLECCWNNQGQPFTALVEYNATNGPLDYLTVHLPKHYLALDPELNANVAVEFTPKKRQLGLYNLTGNFLGVDDYQVAHTVQVTEDNTTVLFTGTISTYGQKLPFAISNVCLHKSDTIQLANVSSGGVSFLTTGLRAQLTKTGTC